MGPRRGALREKGEREKGVSRGSVEPCRVERGAQRGSHRRSMRRDVQGVGAERVRAGGNAAVR